MDMLSSSIGSSIRRMTAPWKPCAVNAEFSRLVDPWLFNVNPKWNYPQLMWAIFVRRNHNAPRSVQHSLTRLCDPASGDTLLGYERVIVNNFEAQLVNVVLIIFLLALTISLDNYAPGGYGTVW